MTFNRNALLAISACSLCAALLLGESNSKASTSAELPTTLHATSTPLPNVVVQRNPFVSFVVPHALISSPTTANPQPRTATYAGNVVGAPPGWVPNPAQAGNPSVPLQTAQNLVILCDTWTVPPSSQAEFTPTAVFLVGNTSLIAVAGETVGGYRISSIKADSVTFDSGDRLGFGDCRPVNETGAQSSTDDDNATPQVAPALNADNAPQQPVSGASGPNVPGQTSGAPSTRAGALPPTSGSDTSSAEHPYGASSTGSYGSSVYGASVPQQQQGVSPFGILQYPGSPNQR